MSVSAPHQSLGEVPRQLTTFEAQSRGFGTGCLRFAPPVTRTGRKTRFRLLAKLCREGLVTLRVRTKGFTMRRASDPPSPSLAWRKSPFVTLLSACGAVLKSLHLGLSRSLDSLGQNVVDSHYEYVL